MIERTARYVKQRNRYVVEHLGDDGLNRQLSIIRSVYASPICDAIDNYNSSAYYEPSYVQTRAYYAGVFV